MKMKNRKWKRNSRNLIRKRVVTREREKDGRVLREVALLNLIGESAVCLK